MATATQPQGTTAPAAAKREWMPRIWLGCDFFALLRLLCRNRFAVQPRFSYIAVIDVIISIFHTLLRWLQEAVYGGRIARTKITQPPLFIIGHWRTGTTLLHELLILDERHSFPSTYECFEPNHFLLTEEFVKRYCGFLMPSRRPMDNMAFGWERPQEDEFALCMMGAPSPYLSIAFPNRPLLDQDAYDPEQLRPRERKRWKEALYGFLQRLTFKDPRRLILKSPTHTSRIKTLLELFPDARFVHIVRNPYVVFPSTVNLWKTLYETHGFQKPTCAGLEEMVFERFQAMYAKLEETRGLVPAGHFHELRYEDLIADPVNQMRTLYEHLGLGEFEKVLPQIEAYLAANAGYQANRYPKLSPELRAEIASRWGAVIERYGYTDPTPNA
jgi:hypothetical protein